MARTFMDRRISKEVIALGIGGQIDRGTDELPPLASVQFQATATADSIKHKFLDDGTIAEITTLTIDKDTFRVVQVARSAEQGELPLAQGGVSQEEADTVAASMGVRTADGSPVEPPPPSGPLLVACEACGHGRGDHAGLETEEGDILVYEGACLVPSCQCQRYVPFEVAPAEEELEPVETEPEGTSA